MNHKSGLVSQNQHLKKFSVFNFVVLVPMFLLVSLWSLGNYDPRISDFAAYWQAGHMIATAQNVYDSQAWVAERISEGTAYHSEPTFQYPLPLAVLLVPFGLLPVRYAYMIWLFSSQVAVLMSVVILLNSYRMRFPYLELLAVPGIFLFRPVFMVLEKGQILPFLLLFISGSMYFFSKNKWFSGGLILSLIVLKPSLGLPILVLVGLWLLFKKQWMGIVGMLSGGVSLLLMGMILNPMWLIDYASIGGASFNKYYGMHPTLWGVVDKIFAANPQSFLVNVITVLIILAIVMYLFWSKKLDEGVMEAYAFLLPAGLLIAPYSWAYDQILLIIPILYLMMKISISWGGRFALLFLFGIIGFAIVLVLIAHEVGHDVWSFLNSFTVWMFVWYFVTQNDPHKMESVAINT